MPRSNCFTPRPAPPRASQPLLTHTPCSYPQGVAFEVTNRTSEAYESVASRSGSVAKGDGGPTFQGKAHSLKDSPAAPAASSAGRALGDARGLSLAAAGDPLFSLPSSLQRPPSITAPMPAAALLAAVPERVVGAAGAVVAVRAAVGAALGLPAAADGGGSAAASPAFTPGSTPVAHSDPAAAHIKVRFDGAGAPTRIFALHADEDTVGVLLAAVASQRAGTGPFELRSPALPGRAFSLHAPKEQLLATLRAAGLAPSASLFVRSLEGV